MIDVSMREALQRIKEECYTVMKCEDCMLYWICPFLRTIEQPPCKFDVNAIVRGCGRRVFEEGGKEHGGKES